MPHHDKVSAILNSIHVSATYITYECVPYLDIIYSKQSLGMQALCSMPYGKILRSEWFTL